MVVGEKSLVGVAWRCQGRAALTFSCLVLRVATVQPPPGVGKLGQGLNLFAYCLWLLLLSTSWLR